VILAAGSLLGGLHVCGRHFFSSTVDNCNVSVYIAGSGERQ